LVTKDKELSLKDAGSRGDFGKAASMGPRVCWVCKLHFGANIPSAIEEWEKTYLFLWVLEA
jgi:hypothetical protein